MIADTNWLAACGDQFHLLSFTNEKSVFAPNSFGGIAFLLRLLSI